MAKRQIEFLQIHHQLRHDSKDFGENIYSRDQAHHPLLNFGIVEKNEYAQIYRSALLGKWGLKILAQHLQKENLPFPKTIIYMHYEGYEGKFPLIGKFALEEEELQDQYGHQFFHPKGEKGVNGQTYINGFNPYDGRRLRRKDLQLRDDYFPQKSIDNFYRILHLILDKKNHPVLFHCFAGKHRTGMVALALRYLRGGHWIHGKKKKVWSWKYQTFFSLNPAQYEYYLHNRYFFRLENLIFIDHFYQRDPLFADFQAKYLSEFFPGVVSLDKRRQAREEKNTQLRKKSLPFSFSKRVLK